MFALPNHSNNQMCPSRWKVQNPFRVTSRIRLKLAACERHRRSDTGMSNFCGPTIAQVYLNLPLEMRILQILWRWDFTRLGVPSRPTEQRNPPTPISVLVPSQRTFIERKRQFPRQNEMDLRAPSFAHFPFVLMSKCHHHFQIGRRFHHCDHRRHQRRRASPCRELWTK